MCKTNLLTSKPQRVNVIYRTQGSHCNTLFCDKWFIQCLFWKCYGYEPNDNNKQYAADDDFWVWDEGGSCWFLDATKKMLKLFFMKCQIKKKKKSYPVKAETILFIIQSAHYVLD